MKRGEHFKAKAKDPKNSDSKAARIEGILNKPKETQYFTMGWILFDVNIPDLVCIPYQIDDPVLL